MTKLTRDKILTKLEHFREYLDYLKKIKKSARTQQEFSADFYLYGSAERYLQLSIQVIIDVINLIIVDREERRPEDNYEAVSKLRSRRVISKKTADNLTAMIGLRNLLVHEYGDIDRKQIYRILHENLKDLDKFYKEVVRYMEKEGE